MQYVLKRCGTAVFKIIVLQKKCHGKTNSPCEANEYSCFTYASYNSST